MFAHQFTEGYAEIVIKVCEDIAHDVLAKEQKAKDRSQHVHRGTHGHGSAHHTRHLPLRALPEFNIDRMDCKISRGVIRIKQAAHATLSAKVCQSSSPSLVKPFELSWK